MNVLFLASSFPDETNQSRGIFNYRFAKQMIGKGIEVNTFFFRIWKPNRKVISSYVYDGVKVTQICLPFIPIDSYFILTINNWIQRFFGWHLIKKLVHSPDIIHSVYLTTSGPIGVYWAKRLKIPHVAQAIGSDVNSDLIAIGNKRHFTKLMKGLDGIITNSKDLERKISHFYPSFENIKTIYRGIHLDYAEKKKHENDRSTFHFLYLGGLTPYKRLQFGANTKGGITLMKAWQKREEELHSLKASLYFGGPNSDNELLYNWKSQLKYPELVKLIGKVDPQVVKKYIGKCYVVIIPSMEEGMPNLLLESQSYGKVVIGSDAGGIPEGIINRKTGFIFKKEDENELAELLVETAKNRNEIEDIGKKAQERVSTFFNADTYSDKVLEFYNKILFECAE